MKRIFLVGNLGNMARRYSSILKYLGIEVDGIDLGEMFDPYKLTTCEGIIIATPTETHVDLIKWYSQYKKPLLVEKPITKSDERLTKLIEYCWDNKVNLRMINQYEYMPSVALGGDHTYYNYWNTGKDGLAWDTINIIGLASGSVTVENDSPVWKCEINGAELNIKDMDTAYIRMIKAWTLKPTENLEYIRQSHDKVRKYLNETNNTWNSGSVD
jgi:hypothetical protein